MVEKLTGRLNGSGTNFRWVAGAQVNGSLLLSDGQVSGPELPMEIQALQLQAADRRRNRAIERWLEKRQNRARAV